jgi:hypothetical protein
MLVNTIKNFLDFKKLIGANSSFKYKGVFGGVTLLCKKDEAFKKIFFILLNIRF